MKVGDGFWCEHELFTVFAPIIGPLGVSVYAAMARMIPLAAIDYDKQVRVRRVSEMSSVGRSKCAEEIRRLIAIGMIVETNYLDGRESTYKLMSLRELAKLGQRELLKRAGVHGTDTAPFDQTVKNRRERERRLQKSKETSAEEAAGRALPLLDHANEPDASGVRPTDTAADEVEDGNGDRQADTVSAKTASVSAKSGLVSAKTALVSARERPFKEGNGREETLTPLPPAERGESEIHESGQAAPDEPDPDQARPSLPGEDLTFGDAGFAAAVPLATAWVMAELGLTSRKLPPLIDAQLTNFCRQSRSATLQDTAARMTQQGRALHEQAHLLRHNPWGWPRFIGEGHWARPLPFDREKQRAAAVVSSPATDNAEGRTMLREFRQAKLRRWAEALEQKGFAAEAAQSRELADRCGELETPALVEALRLIEDAVVATGLKTYDADSLAQVERGVERAFEEMRTRYKGMPAEDFERTKQELRRRRLFVAYDLMRLNDLT